MTQLAAWSLSQDAGLLRQCVRQHDRLPCVNSPCVILSCDNLPQFFFTFSRPFGARSRNYYIWEPAWRLKLVACRLKLVACCLKLVACSRCPGTRLHGSLELLGLVFHQIENNLLVRIFFYFSFYFFLFLGEQCWQTTLSRFTPWFTYATTVVNSRPKAFLLQG